MKNKNCFIIVFLDNQLFSCLFVKDEKNVSFKMLL